MNKYIVGIDKDQHFISADDFEAFDGHASFFRKDSQGDSYKTAVFFKVDYFYQVFED